MCRPRKTNFRFLFPFEANKQKFVEGGTARGTTALVYWQLHSSLYTDAVQGWWSTPNWSDRRQGCTQVSTSLPFPFPICSKQMEVAVVRYPFCAYINILRWLHICFKIYIYIYIYILPFQMENGSPGNNSLIHLLSAHLLIMQIEVCHLSVCWWRNKRKLSVCKRTKWLNGLAYLCIWSGLKDETTP